MTMYVFWIRMVVAVVFPLLMAGCAAQVKSGAALVDQEREKQAIVAVISRMEQA